MTDDANTKDPYEHIEPLRSQRLGTQAGSFMIDALARENTPWFETPEDIEAGLAWGREKEALLARVREWMAACLSDMERKSIALYYFENLNYRDAADRLGVNASTVCRAVHRATEKLRVELKKASPEDPSGIQSCSESKARPKRTADRASSSMRSSTAASDRAAPLKEAS
jgi:predicted DNA-binding protein (UPF0251 family)